MRQQHKDALFHLRAITTQSALVFALLKAHLFSTQASLIALTQDLTPLKRLTYHRRIALSRHGKLYDGLTVFLVSMTTGL